MWFIVTPCYTNSTGPTQHAEQSKNAVPGHFINRVHNSILTELLNSPTFSSNHKNLIRTPHEMMIIEYILSFSVVIQKYGHLCISSIAFGLGKFRNTAERQCVITRSTSSCSRIVDSLSLSKVADHLRRGGFNSFLYLHCHVIAIFWN